MEAKGSSGCGQGWARFIVDLCTPSRGRCLALPQRAVCEQDGTWCGIPLRGYTIAIGGLGIPESEVNLWTTEP
jgi:hypothetical protein